jgi:hypothetical protein
VIENSSVTARASFGSGIGGGYIASGESTIGDITIVNSTINATSLSNGCGVGSSSGGKGSASVQHISISHSTVIASASQYGSGIGAGYWTSATAQSTTEEITITDSVIISSGSANGPSIGAGHLGSRVDSLKFFGHNIVNSTSTANFPQINATSILLCNASVVFVAPSMPVFSSPPLNDGWFDLVVFYRQQTPTLMELISSLVCPFLHIQKFDLPGYLMGTMCISEDCFHHCFEGYTSDVLSAVISVPSPGNYTLPATLNGISGFLETPQNISVFTILGNGANVSIARFAVASASMTPNGCALSPRTVVTRSPDARPPPTLGLSSGFRVRPTDALTDRLGYAFDVSPQYLASSEGIQSFITGSSMVGRNSMVAFTSVPSRTNDLGASKDSIDSAGFTGSEEHVENVISERPLTSVRSSDHFPFMTVLESSADVSDSLLFRVNDHTVFIERGKTRFLSGSTLIFSRVSTESVVADYLTGIVQSESTDETVFLSQSNEFSRTQSFSDVRSPPTSQNSSTVSASEFSIRSGTIKISIAQGQSGVLAVSGYLATLANGDSGAKRESTYFSVSLDSWTLQSLDFSDEARVTRTAYASGQFDFLSKFCVSGLSDDSAESAGTNTAAVSGAFDFSFLSRASDVFFGSILVGPSEPFSLSEVDIRRLYWDSVSIDVSGPLANSMVLPNIEVRHSLSSRGIEITFDESGSIRAGFRANADRGSSLNDSVALGAGFAVGLLLVILLVGGFLFWFATWARAETDDTEMTEFATDPDDSLAGNDMNCEAGFAIDSYNPWVGDQGVISGSDDLVMRDNDPFANASMAEEGAAVKSKP